MSDKKQTLAEEIFLDNMSDFTIEHIEKVEYLKDWILDAMQEYADRLKLSVEIKNKS